MKEDLGHARSLCDFSKLCARRSALPQIARSVLSRAELGLSAQLERSIAGESFSAQVNRRRLEALRQLTRHRRTRQLAATFKNGETRNRTEDTTIFRDG
jgi:hypothetical protein